VKHAYLILAHNEFDILKALVSCLDDGRNDIFVHIDSKVNELPDLYAAKAGFYFVENRVDVRWGDLSVVEAEYALFEKAKQNGPYQYYHLLSGVDLPLKSQDYIHDFCDKNEGKEFIGYTLTEITPEVVRKVQRWHLFLEDFKNKSTLKRIIRASYIKFQEIFGIKRNKDVNFKKGSQWVSITDGLVGWILENKEWVMKTFSHTFCADEIFVQTLCWNSPYKDNIFNTDDDAAGCMRAIGWRNGRLEDWFAKDYDHLKNSPALFARKFNSRDWNFIEKVISLSKL